LYKALDAEFPYMALDTCATDGLCATACPVSIDTGQLVKRFRNMRAPVQTQKWALRIAQNFAATERLLRWALRLGHISEAVIGTTGMKGITRLLKRRLGDAGFEWTADVPNAAASVPRTRREGAQAIYFPSCISRVMGRLPDEVHDRSLMEVMVEVAARAGVPVHIPSDVVGTCCGTPFSSKGLSRAYTASVNLAIERFWRWSEQGRLPIVIDTSPCTYGLKTSRPYLTEENQARWDKLKFLDSIEFVHDQLLPGLLPIPQQATVALHPVCSVTKMGIGAKLESIARACSASVFVPRNAGCCGFAGDRGFLVPELTRSATRLEADEVRQNAADECYSSSRTCEIGMSRATGQVYRSYLYLLEKATRPAPGSRN
jgi:D-lactate dehydrogenase